MNIITKENYFDLNNHALSQSKIKDFELCPNYFYRKHITGEFKKDGTSAFSVGTEVDELLTDINAINETVVFEGDRRTKEGKEQYATLVESGKKIVTRAEYDQIIAVADAGIKTSAYEVIKRQFTFQEIIQVPMELGEHFDSLYGMIDAYYIDEEDGVCTLLDLKTTRDISDRGYYYNALKYGYFKQLWFYAHLLQNKYPEIKRFKFYHYAVEKTEPYRVKLFEIPFEYIDREGESMLLTIEKIKNEKQFKKADATFISPTLLTDPREDIN